MSPLTQARLSRRALLGAAAALPLLDLKNAFAAPNLRPPAFKSVAATTADTVSVPEGYRWRTLIAWGDPLTENAAPFSPDSLTRAEQEKRFGQNNDMLALFPAKFSFPAPRAGADFLLCANHEYFEPALLFPSLKSRAEMTKAQWEAAYASLGCSVLRVTSARGAWRVVRKGETGAGINRRITPFTPVKFTGPAANHKWIAAASTLVNKAENRDGADGLVACGTMANCAGGQTPWGTYLTSEENFNNYFYLSDPGTPAAKAAQADQAWKFDSGKFGTPLISLVASGAPDQYDVAKNPYGPALYGWVVEIDPYEPAHAPRKLTALGRKKGECATTALTRDSRVAVYMGDDQINECVYKFVSRRKFDPKRQRADLTLLEDGDLYAAKFNDDGSGEWLHLTLAAANAAVAEAPSHAPFADNADVMVRAREAAGLLGATPMDRPEDVEAILDDHWVGLGPVLIVCTYNRQDEFPHAGNPRRLDTPGEKSPNMTGHILRIDESGGDCGATKFAWDIFLVGGDPAADDKPIATPINIDARVSTTLKGKTYNTGTRFACPDNITFDRAGNIWISTDGSQEIFGDCNDAIMVTSVAGEGPRDMRRFLVGPVGCEVCGPTIAPNQRAFLASIQHPGETDLKANDFAAARWTGSPPFSHFPDGGWPRSAVVVVTREDGGVIGG